MANTNFVVSGADLTDGELELVKEESERTAEKLDALYEGDNSLQMHVKTYNDDGTRKKYSVKVNYDTPVGSFHSKDDDWDLALCVKQCLSKLERIVIEDHKKELDKRHHSE